MANTATEKLVTVKIPRERGNDADVYISVNDRSWLIKRGVAVDVPECVAEVLRNQEKAMDIADAFNEANESK